MALRVRAAKSGGRILLLDATAIQTGTRVRISLWDSLMFGRVPGTRSNISESHSEISTRVPFCIAAGPAANYSTCAPCVDTKINGVSVQQIGIYGRCTQCPYGVQLREGGAFCMCKPGQQSSAHKAETGTSACLSFHIQKRGWGFLRAQASSIYTLCSKRIKPGSEEAVRLKSNVPSPLASQSYYPEKT